MTTKNEKLPLINGFGVIVADEHRLNYSEKRARPVPESKMYVSTPDGRIEGMLQLPILGRTGNEEVFP